MAAADPLDALGGDALGALRRVRAEELPQRAVGEPEVAQNGPRPRVGPAVLLGEAPGVSIPPAARLSGASGHVLEGPRRDVGEQGVPPPERCGGVLMVGDSSVKSSDKIEKERYKTMQWLFFQMANLGE